MAYSENPTVCARQRWQIDTSELRGFESLVCYIAIPTILGALFTHRRAA
jgi:hypothetical protein